jgi:hypothetical protein
MIKINSVKSIIFGEIFLIFLIILLLKDGDSNYVENLTAFHVRERTEDTPCV